MFAEVNSLSNLRAKFEDNVLTLYDESKDPTDPDSGYVLSTVDNIDTLNKLSVLYETDSDTGISTLSFYDGDS